MTIKQLIKNLSDPKNWFYYIQGKYHKLVKWQYERVYGKDNIDDMLYKTAQCSECYLNGSCIECGCSFDELITTNKKCPNGKF